MKVELSKSIDTLISPTVTSLNSMKDNISLGRFGNGAGIWN